MKTIRKFILAALLGTVAVNSTAQTINNCPNLDFSYGNTYKWQCYSGSCLNGNYWVQPDTQIRGRIDIMNVNLFPIQNLFDANCRNIKTVPNGHIFSCRIGNSNIGAEVDAIEYTLTVDSSISLLVLNFAWVMQYAAGHDSTEQARFTMKITDSVGNPLNLPCSNIVFMADTNLPNLACKGSLVASDWKTAGFNLESFMGQTIKIYFETRDCSHGCHFGYAYIVGECRPVRIGLQYCAWQTTARLGAPEGFTQYEWTRSSDLLWRDNNRQINPQQILNGEIFTVILTSELGCISTFSVVIDKTSINDFFMFGVKNVNGHVDFQTLGYQNWYDTCSRTVTFVDLSQVYNGKKKSILWEIPELKGVSGRDSVWTYTFPDPDTPTTYLVRLIVSTENGCTDTSNAANHYITIYPSSKTIYYSATICQGSAFSDAHFSNLKQTGIYYDTLQNIYGCDSVICLNLTVTPAPFSYYSASICQGDTYTDALFTDLTQPGVYFDTLQTAGGCDSLILFTLMLNGLPAKPVITNNRNELTSSGAYTYQWYFNDTLVLGANKQTYICTQNGIYFVEITNEYGCKAKSDTINITDVGINEWTIENGQLKIYPNPTNGQLTTLINREQLTINNIEIFDVAGRKVETLRATSLQNNTITIDISHLANGTYFLKINNQIIKIIKN